MHTRLAGVVAATALIAAPAHAASDSWKATPLGANEVGACDRGGFGRARVAIDIVANTINWSTLALGIDLPLMLAPIHSGATGVNGHRLLARTQRRQPG